MSQSPIAQLPLPIALSQHRGQEGLLVHRGNERAIALLRNWPRWPSPCALLVGPRRSGRSLIGRMVAADLGAHVVDDAAQADERQLFNLWNEARDADRPLLLIAAHAPPVWAVALPDLRTRLATAAVARIEPPDEAIAAALVVRGLEAAGSAFAPDVPEFVARRTPRCYEAIDLLIARLNALSLSSGQKLSVGLARQTLSDGSDLDDATPA